MSTAEGATFVQTEQRRSTLSLILALVIILGSAWIGWWRSEKAGRGQTPLFAPSAGVAPAPLVSSADPVREPELSPGAPETDVDESAEPAVAASLPLPASGTLAPAELDSLLAEMRGAARQDGVLEGGEASAYNLALRVLAADPAQRDARSILKRALEDMLDAGERVLPEELLALAQQAVAKARLIEFETALAARVAESVARTEDALAQLKRAERRVSREGATRKSLIEAREAYRAVLAVDPTSVRALRGLDELQRVFLQRALAAAHALRFDEADELLSDADSVQSGTSQMLDVRSQVMAFRSQIEAEQLSRFKDALAARRLDEAATAIATLEKLRVDAGQLNDLRSKLENSRLYGGFSPGERFADELQGGLRGPRLVVVPVGSFRMGSPNDEAGRNDSEGPQREIVIDRGFAMARAEITVAEFASFVEASGYQTDAERSGSSAVYDEQSGRISKSRRAMWRRNYSGARSRDNDPVVHVSWNDAAAYAEWLTQVSGARYRLPSEAEFEYALRAGTQSRYPWGDGPPATAVANIAGAAERSLKAKRSWSQGMEGYDDGFWGPAPARSFPANAFGFFDLDGNLSEWVEDCWHDNFRRAPEGAGAWVNPGCELRVIRGGSWGSAADQVRSAWRGSALSSSSGPRVGFRVVRELVD